MSGPNDCFVEEQAQLEVESELMLSSLPDAYKEYYEMITAVVLLEYESSDDDHQLFSVGLLCHFKNVKN